MIKNIGDSKKTIKEEKQENEPQICFKEQSWKEVMLRKFLRSHYNENYQDV